MIFFYIYSKEQLFFIIQKVLKKMVKCECPSCYFEFGLDDGTIEGEVIPCPDCGVDLEITKIEGAKVEVIVAELTEEDWGE